MQAQHEYACCLWNGGKGIEVDQPGAAEYFKLAADQGYAPAQLEYGLCLKNGLGVEVDKTKAAHYFKLAADQGLKVATPTAAVRPLQSPQPSTLRGDGMLDSEGSIRRLDPLYLLYAQNALVSFSISSDSAAISGEDVAPQLESKIRGENVSELIREAGEGAERRLKTFFEFKERIDAKLFGSTPNLTTNGVLIRRGSIPLEREAAPGKGTLRMTIGGIIHDGVETSIDGESVRIVDDRSLARMGAEVGSLNFSIAFVNIESEGGEGSAKQLEHLAHRSRAGFLKCCFQLIEKQDCLEAYVDEYCDRFGIERGERGIGEKIQEVSRFFEERGQGRGRAAERGVDGQEAAEPPKPGEVAKPGEPPEPAKPAEAAKAAKPAEPPEPPKPAKPAKAAEPAKPPEPAKAAKPPEPAKPKAKPSEPAKPKAKPPEPEEDPKESELIKELQRSLVSQLGDGESRSAKRIQNKENAVALKKIEERRFGI
jgi:hypothetical protein